MSDTGLAPISEEDRPKIESTIKYLKRLRKRDHANNRKHTDTDLDVAIHGLMMRGYYAGWWEDPDDYRF